MATIRFMAASVARMEGSVIERLLAMRRAIAPFNVARGLRTVLLHSGGWFVQWHEGPADAIERTWRISLSHPTHRHARVIHRSLGAALLREPVQIVALAGPDAGADVARKLSGIAQEQQAQAMEPVEIWRRFVAPAPAGDRVIAVVSESNESLDVLKALAARWRATIHYQRVAGPGLHTGDAGAAYADTGHAGRRTRVQALAHHALGLGIVRLSLPRLDAVLLLVSAHSRRAPALFDATVAFAASFESRPALHVVDPDRRDALLTLLEIVAATL